MESRLRAILEYAERMWGEEAGRKLERMRRMDPLELLVRTVLSQNTSDRNADEAFGRLVKLVGGDLRRIASVSEERLAEAIRPAGMHRVRARTLRMLIGELKRRYGLRLDWIRALPTHEARRELLSLPGVGFKTADIMLAFYGGHPVLPVDTHIRRIAIRLGYARPNAAYDRVREALEQEIEPGRRALAHLLLLAFGRRVCTARRPACDRCPLGSCPGRPA